MTPRERSSKPFSNHSIALSFSPRPHGFGPRTRIDTGSLKQVYLKQVYLDVGYHEVYPCPEYSPRPALPGSSYRKFWLKRRRLMRTRFALLVLAFLAVSAGLGAADDPLVGTWKLNLAKSKFSPPPPPQDTS